MCTDDEVPGGPLGPGSPFTPGGPREPLAPSGPGEPERTIVMGTLCPP